MEAAQLSGTDYQEFMNPFLDDVGRSTVDTMRREFDNNQAKAGAHAANSIAFGGSGAALERAQNARNFNQDATSTVANLMSGGFDRASALASQNVDREQQARQQNAGNSLQAAGIYGNLYGDDFNRGRSSLADLLGVGTQQQQDTQANLDSRWDILQKLGAFIPSVYNTTETSNSTGTQPNQNPSGLQSALGLAGTVLGGPASGVPGTASLLSKLLGV